MDASLHLSAHPYVAVEALPFVRRFVYLAETDSTSLVARREGVVPDTGMVVYCAERQHAGRGRRGRSFFSADGGLWVTLVLPLTDLSQHFSINRALSLAVCQTVHDCAPNASLAVKWPNDIYWGERKLCGILLETAGHMPRALIAGFGLNVNIEMQQFPADLQSIATSVLAQTGTNADQAQLLQHLLEYFDQFLREDPGTLHERYRSMLYGRGRQAMVDTVAGQLVDVLPDGRLVLDTGKETLHCSGGTLRLL